MGVYMRLWLDFAALAMRAYSAIFSLRLLLREEGFLLYLDILFSEMGSSGSMTYGTWP